MTLVDNSLKILKKYWVVLAIALIILMGFQVRMLDYRWDYLRNIDSYVYYRWMDEIVLNNGILPIHDQYVLGPVGIDRNPNWPAPYMYLGAYSYIFFAALIPGLTLIQYLIFFPAFLAALSAIPMYYIGKMLFDKKAGILAAFFYVFEFSNIPRSLGGDPDTDAIVILMQAVTMAFFVWILKKSEKTEMKYNRKNLTLSFIAFIIPVAVLFLNLLAGLILFLAVTAALFVKFKELRLMSYIFLTAFMFWLWYSVWAGYWYIIWLVIGFVVLKFLSVLVQKRNIMQTVLTTKNLLSAIVIMLLISFVLTLPFYGGLKIVDAAKGPFDFQSIKGEESEFPNVYVSVAELQEGGDIKSIITRTSAVQGIGILLSPFALMIYALIYLFTSAIISKKDTTRHYDSFLLMLIWFIGPFMATIVAIRFSILFSAPMAIGSAIILSKILRMVSKEDEKWTD